MGEEEWGLRGGVEKKKGGKAQRKWISPGLAGVRSNMGHLGELPLRTRRQLEMTLPNAASISKAYLFLSCQRQFKR
jgi:hypothetical protein